MQNSVNVKQIHFYFHFFVAMSNSVNVKQIHLYGFLWLSKKNKKSDFYLVRGGIS